MQKIMGLDVGTKRIGIALSDFLLLTGNNKQRTGTCCNKKNNIALRTK